MKRCPECRRDYYDDTLFYCLDDGNALLDGPATADQLIGLLPTIEMKSGSSTSPLNLSEEQTAILPSGIYGSQVRRSLDKRLLAAPFLLAVIVLAGFGYWYFKPDGSGPINSIAVLPFQNNSADADTDYLSDGLAESLIFRLSQLPGFESQPDKFGHSI